MEASFSRNHVITTVVKGLAFSFNTVCSQLFPASTLKLVADLAARKNATYSRSVYIVNFIIFGYHWLFVLGNRETVNADDERKREKYYCFDIL